MQQRCPILLLEMIIALVLMGGVMALLVSGFYGAIQGKNKIKAEQAHILTLERLRLRFEQLFKAVIDFKALSPTEYFIQYSSDVDHQMNFRSPLTALLTLQDKQLVLISWPQEGAPRQEVLGQDVASIHFEFFDEEKGKFHSQYPPKKPVMMKVVVDQAEIPLFL